MVMVMASGDGDGFLNGFLMMAFRDGFWEWLLMIGVPAKLQET